MINKRKIESEGSYTSVLQFRVLKHIKQDLETICANNGIKPSKALRIALKDFIARYKKN